MTSECHWVESRLEDLFSDDPVLQHAIDRHLQSCPPCQRQVRDQEKMHQLVRLHFDSRLGLASLRAAARPRTGRRLALGGACAALVIALWVGLSWPDGSILPNSTSTLEKTEGGGAPLAKSSDVMPAIASDGPGESPLAVPPDRGFYVVDAAGYAYTLSDFGGSVVVLGVFDESAGNSEKFVRLFETMPARTDLRFLAISPGPVASPRLQDFPVMVNRGSTLLGIEAGEFAILTRDGEIYRRGQLADATFEAAVRSSLVELGLDLPE